MFVHGALDRGASFARVRRRLRDHTVVTYDRRGYAGSLAVPVATGIERHVADLAEIVGDEPVVVVGHSFGGLIALSFAAELPLLTNAAVVYEPPLAWLPWWHGAGNRAAGARADPAEAAERFFRSVVGDAAWERLDADERDLRRQEGPALVADLTATRDAAPFEPARVVAPTIVARGERARERHRRGAAELATWLGEAEPTVVAGAAHGAHMSHPDSFAGLVESAIARTQT